MSVLPPDVSAMEVEFARSKLPEELRELWHRSPERRRWLYWHSALEHNDLTAEEREDIVELAGSVELVAKARDVALLDFLSRMIAESREEKAAAKHAALAKAPLADA